MRSFIRETSGTSREFTIVGSDEGGKHCLTEPDWKAFDVLHCSNKCSGCCGERKWRKVRCRTRILFIVLIFCYVRSGYFLLTSFVVGSTPTSLLKNSQTPIQKCSPLSKTHSLTSSASSSSPSRYSYMMLQLVCSGQLPQLHCSIGGGRNDLEVIKLDAPHSALMIILLLPLQLRVRLAECVQTPFRIHIPHLIKKVSGCVVLWWGEEWWCYSWP